ncbi:Rpn family recombination-promoting nuclease/putative transposase [Nostoc sp. FACHB-110]|uniref:Rpn family recombination-promoting nuclease/putative transposase n=1 Tax=Nostoc sp. FACHB-110 TaxID=2692834 RepID=UPI001686ABFA|nr:Rpn family recombination-promoting nuclease/putative transposase [Nostoc sp. FACHB-110]MBD2439872.1 Rpn family recombination-promoting nuclease/putative transposase [Nostoc sp. FACHB-110]
MKTDTIFYKLFQEFPNIFFELIGKPETNTNLYEFKSQEIKETGFRLDGIFLTLDSNSEITANEPIYFVEVQCYKDKRFYDRLFSSILLYFYQYQPINPNWYAIVIFDARTNDVDFPERLNSLREEHLICLYLDEIADTPEKSLGLGIVKLIVEGQPKAQESVKQLVNQARAEVKDTAIQRKILELIEAILVNKFPNLSREEIKAMLSLELIRGTRVYQELKEEAREEVKQEVKQELKAEAREEVREEVKQELKAEAREEVREEVKQELKAEAREEVREEVKQELKAEAREEVREEVKQELKAEVKTEMIAKLLQRGMSVEEVAEILELDVEVIRDVAGEQL